MPRPSLQSTAGARTMAAAPAAGMGFTFSREEGPSLATPRPQHLKQPGTHQQAENVR